MLRQIDKIYNAGLKFLDILTPQETYFLIVEEAINLVSAQSGSIFLEEKGELFRAYTSAPELKKLKPRKRGYLFKTFKSGTHRIKTISDFGQIRPILRKKGVKATAFLPLTYQQKTIGVLTLNALTKFHFNQKEIKTLNVFLQLASLAIIKTNLLNQKKTALEGRDLFISMAAHEFKTPLTSIIGYTQLLLKKIDSIGSDEARWLKELSFETERLRVLINDLLEISRIQTGRHNYYYKESDLKEIIRRAIETFSQNHPSRVIDFKDKVRKEQLWIICDFEKIMEVIINILDNAAKYSDENEKIYLTFQAKDTFVLINVEDKGVGISKKHLPYIFKGFYKGEDRVKGMGLGLYLAKNIVDQHHGTIEIRSKVNKGTKVEIKLQRAKM